MAAPFQVTPYSELVKRVFNLKARNLLTTLIEDLTAQFNVNAGDEIELDWSKGYRRVSHVMEVTSIVSNAAKYQFINPRDSGVLAVFREATMWTNVALLAIDVSAAYSSLAYTGLGNSSTPIYSDLRSWDTIGGAGAQCTIQCSYEAGTPGFTGHLFSRNFTGTSTKVTLDAFPLILPPGCAMRIEQNSNAVNITQLNIQWYERVVEPSELKK